LEELEYMVTEEEVWAAVKEIPQIEREELTASSAHSTSKLGVVICGRQKARGWQNRVWTVEPKCAATVS
jgi:hypothetical protein